MVKSCAAYNHMPTAAKIINDGIRLCPTTVAFDGCCRSSKVTGCCHLADMLPACCLDGPAADHNQQSFQHHVSLGSSSSATASAECIECDNTALHQMINF